MGFSKISKNEGACGIDDQILHLLSFLVIAGYGRY